MDQPDIETSARFDEDARRQAEAMRSDGPAASRLADVAEPLSQQMLQSIEALQVAEEELRAQNLELVETHESLELERRQYRVLFDSAPRPFIVTDLSGTIRMVNQAASELLRANPEVLVGKPLATYVALDDRHRFRQELNSMARAASAPPTIEPRHEMQLTITPRGGEPVAGRRR